jgi:hypothetical protein
LFVIFHTQFNWYVRQNLVLHPISQSKFVSGCQITAFIIVFNNLEKVNQHWKLHVKLFILTLVCVIANKQSNCTMLNKEQIIIMLENSAFGIVPNCSNIWNETSSVLLTLKYLFDSAILTHDSFKFLIYERE